MVDFRLDKKPQKPVRTNKNRLIFVHCPRTGGGTFATYLNRWYNLDRLTALGHFPYEPHYRNQFLITFVRNPLDQIVSRWRYWNDIGRKRKAPSMIFKSPIQMIDTNDLYNMQTKYWNGAKFEDWDFIGLTECYAESIVKFIAKAPIFNNSEFKPDLTFKKNESIKQDMFMSKWEQPIIDRMSEDFKIYNKVCKLYGVSPYRRISPFEPK